MVPEFDVESERRCHTLENLIRVANTFDMTTVLHSVLESSGTAGNDLAGVLPGFCVWQRCPNDRSDRL